MAPPTYMEKIYCSLIAMGNTCWYLLNIMVKIVGIRENYWD